MRDKYDLLVQLTSEGIQQQAVRQNQVGILQADF